ncbi:MAG: carbamoyl-phosphate synthase large subunit [Neisseriaceae bacterium]|nr:MAG: carbamoyl-phosphate synthase large subunit [Neisseriaceae bacterium]
MPKRTDLKSILIIGAGPIVIGQACEFDYSGTQACKALREEGYKVILVNSNPATIMTDPEIADVTYVEPIQWQVVERIIEKERPDAILPTMGGQTALNCALDLGRNGVLEKYNVELIGASEDAINKAEDRGRFKEAMRKIGLSCPKSFVCHSIQEALEAQNKIGFPTLIRPSFTMGGSGGGIAYNKEEFLEICERGFEASPTHELLIEQSVLRWKEYEMEVIRDKNDNCIIVCSIENFDPMGVHTGDSITVAPIQTLTDKEYQIMRNASIAVLREIGVDTGGANVQFAVNPVNGEMIVIEMNPRVSRSSALASKATGFPIAKVAAKLAVGFTLDEIKNDITAGKTPASFEPSIDYVVTKIPRFAFEKFPVADDHLTTQMKSVGEVMAIGRTFQESVQKALRGLETGLSGFDPKTEDEVIIRQELVNPKADRILYVADAFRVGMSLEEINKISSIDPWFLAQIQDIVTEEQELSKKTLETVELKYFKRLKAKGFSDKRIASLVGTSEVKVREFRMKDLRLYPVFKRVDTCAGEFETDTAYMYSTYEDFDEARPSTCKKIIILGGGPNRIGQGIEFDYCCVHASLALKERGWETIMVNCNPETVSTDFDTSDRLYFEPLTLEDILNIVHIEKPDGMIVHYGGQTPLKLANELVANGVNIVGTSANSIDLAEDREKFKKILDDLGLKQPPNRIAYKVDDAMMLAEQIGYPLVVRPSYVLGGRAMQVVNDSEQLLQYMTEAVKISEDNPILLDRFLNNAIEVDVDCVSDGEKVVIGGLMQHIEQAGVHSGDSACSIPAYSLTSSIQDEIRRQTKEMARAIQVVGLMNVQFAVQGSVVYVLEVNPRASRTVPFVSKATGVPLAKVGARVMLGEKLSDIEFTEEIIPEHYFVKEAVFPFIKFPGVDTILGPEMRSTGEVMGIGKTFAEAFIKSQLGANSIIPNSGCVFMSVRDEDKIYLPQIATNFLAGGYTLCATKGTAIYLQERGFNVEVVNKVMEGRPHIVDKIKNGGVAIVINTVNDKIQSIQDSHSIRRSALTQNVPLYTTITAGLAVSQGIEQLNVENTYSLQSLYSTSHISFNLN